LWEQMAIFGAGNTFLQSLPMKRKEKVSQSFSEKPTYQEANNEDNKIWDFRFVNNSAMVFHSSLKNQFKKPNVRLQSKKMIKFPNGTKREVRAFYTTQHIKKNEQVLWDYKFHRKNREECECGKAASECSILKGIINNQVRDHIVEKIYKRVDQRSSLDSYVTSRLLVKYKDLDPVCNEFVEDLTLEKTEVYEKWRKKEKKIKFEKAKTTAIIIGTNLSNQQNNADNSSGAEDEDERAPGRLSKPKEVLYLCRESHLNAEKLQVRQYPVL
jgi:hypothetical protein